MTDLLDLRRSCSLAPLAARTSTFSPCCYQARATPGATAATGAPRATIGPGHGLDAAWPEQFLLGIFAERFLSRHQHGVSLSVSLSHAATPHAIAQHAQDSRATHAEQRAGFGGTDSDEQLQHEPLRALDNLTSGLSRYERAAIATEVVRERARGLRSRATSEAGAGKVTLNEDKTTVVYSSLYVFKV